MYSIVLMAAMTTAPEAPGFGDMWAKHCFWESCLPARYGWVACGPGYQAFYPAAYTSCCGYGGGFHHYKYTCHGCWSSCHGCGGCGGCWGGCYGAGYGCGMRYHACSGAYYNCYGGGGVNIFAGIGYSGFGAYGNYGNYGTVPFFAAPVYQFPGFENRNTLQPLPRLQPDVIVPQRTESFTSQATPSTPAKPEKASIVVKVPENARLYIDGHLTQSKSAERTFMSPPIEPGETFFYNIRIVAQKDGKESEEVRRVPVRAGEVTRLSFDEVFDKVRPDDRAVVDSTRNPVK